LTQELENWYKVPKDETTNLKHVLLKNKMLSPGIDDIALQPTARRPEIEQPFDATMDFE
jgi:hypothetical protein